MTNPKVNPTPSTITTTSINPQQSTPNPDTLETGRTLHLLPFPPETGETSADVLACKMNDVDYEDLRSLSNIGHLTSANTSPAKNKKSGTSRRKNGGEIESVLITLRGTLTLTQIKEFVNRLIDSKSLHLPSSSKSNNNNKNSMNSILNPNEITKYHRIPSNCTTFEYVTRKNLINSNTATGELGMNVHVLLDNFDCHNFYITYTNSHTHNTNSGGGDGIDWIKECFDVIEMGEPLFYLQDHDRKPLHKKKKRKRFLVFRFLFRMIVFLLKVLWVIFLTPILVIMSFLSSSTKSNIFTATNTHTNAITTATEERVQVQISSFKIPLSDVKHISSIFNCTLDDVVHCVLSGGVRDYVLKGSSSSSSSEEDKLIDSGGSGGGSVNVSDVEMLFNSTASSNNNKNMPKFIKLPTSKYTLEDRIKALKNSASILSKRGFTNYFLKKASVVLPKFVFTYLISCVKGGCLGVFNNVNCDDGSSESTINEIVIDSVTSIPSIHFTTKRNRLYEFNVNATYYNEHVSICYTTSTSTTTVNCETLNTHLTTTTLTLKTLAVELQETRRLQRDLEYAQMLQVNIDKVKLKDPKSEGYVPHHVSLMDFEGRGNIHKRRVKQIDDDEVKLNVAENHHVLGVEEESKIVLGTHGLSSNYEIYPTLQHSHMHHHGHTHGHHQHDSKQSSKINKNNSMQLSLINSTLSPRAATNTNRINNTFSRINNTTSSMRINKNMSMGFSLMNTPKAKHPSVKREKVVVNGNRDFNGSNKEGNYGVTRAGGGNVEGRDRVFVIL